MAARKRVTKSATARTKKKARLAKRGDGPKPKPGGKGGKKAKTPEELKKDALNASLKAASARVKAALGEIDKSGVTSAEAKDAMAEPSEENMAKVFGAIDKLQKAGDNQELKFARWLTFLAMMKVKYQAPIYKSDATGCTVDVKITQGSGTVTDGSYGIKKAKCDDARKLVERLKEHSAACTLFDRKNKADKNAPTHAEIEIRLLLGMLT